jgi:Type III restriction enzyme, res subunit
MLTLRGCELPKTPAVSARVRKELRVVPYSPVQTLAPASFDVFVETDDAYVVPHFWGVQTAEALGIPLTDERPPGAPAPALVFEGDLRPAQKPIVDATLAHLADTGGSVVCAPTGHGKTAMALFLAARCGVKTMVLVHKAFLAQQWIDRARQFVPHAKCTMYGNGTWDCSGDLVVATIQTVLRRGVPAEVARQLGLVIIDEVHRIAAPSFSKATLGLNARRILGLSATPDRADRLTRVLHWVCGPLVSAEAPSMMEHDVNVIRATFRKERAIPQNARGDVDHATLITQLAEDDERTAFIVGEMKKHVPISTPCLVLSHRRAHCQLLAECLRQQGYDAETYLGGDASAPDARVLVATYSLVSEGFDRPELAALVLATPASTITQAVGRILRRPGPKTILDVVDTNAVSYAQANKRRALYASAGYLKGRGGDTWYGSKPSRPQWTPVEEPRVYMFQ